MVDQMGTPMALAFQMMGKLVEIPGRVKWQLQVIFWLLQTLFHIRMHALSVLAVMPFCASLFVANCWYNRPMLRKKGHNAPGFATQEELW